MMIPVQNGPIKQLKTRWGKTLAAKVIVTAVGGALLLAGLAGLLIPVIPGWLLILPGLAILAGEYVWARRLLDGARTQISRARSRRGESARQAASREAA